jgi:hypothetical protein
MMVMFSEEHPQSIGGTCQFVGVTGEQIIIPRNDTSKNCKPHNGTRMAVYFI